MSAVASPVSDCLVYGAQVVVMFTDEGRKRDFVCALMQRRPKAILSPLLERTRALGMVGYVSRGRTLLSGFSVRENVYMPLQHRHPCALQELHQRTKLLCDFGGIATPLLERKADELSALEQIQASFLQAAVGEPDLLVFDAVFEGLTFSDQDRVAKLVSGYHSLYPLRRVLYLGYVPPPSDLYATSAVWLEEPI